jgi:AcrR family transcriptional regulator
MNETVERALEAMNALAGERPWFEVTLRAIAEKAGVPLTELFPLAPSKTALIDHLAARLDAAALATAATPGEDAHDRLFDAVMARVEAMEPWRAILAGAPVVALLPLAPHLPRTARAVLEAAGIEATPPRLMAMTAVWARTLQVWRADEGALNRTMAEIDRRLKDMRRGLRRLGQGF